MADKKPSQNVFFRPEELGYFDQVSSEVPTLVAPRAKYYLKVLPPATAEAPFKREVLYGEQKVKWKYVGPIIIPMYIETPAEPKEFEENRGGNLDINATVYVNRKLFEDAFPDKIVPVVKNARGSLVPDSGDVIVVWTTHEGDVAAWDVESVERDQYLGDLPLHLQWRLILHRRSRYVPERSLARTQDSAPTTGDEPVVVLDPDDVDKKERNPSLRPETPFEGKTPR